MRFSITYSLAIFSCIFLPFNILYADIAVSFVSTDLSKLPLKSDLFTKASEETISLIAQPMVVPRPKVTTTDKLKVKAIHNGTWIAFQLVWTDLDKSDGGKLGEFSDAVAIQFPIKDNANPPPIFMGMKDNPVHIFHWRAQYQLDKEKGLRDIKDIYPNMHIDMYPMDFPDMPSTLKADPTQKEMYSFGRAAGNPQSYVKKGIDEIYAEGFGTSAVIQNIESEADGKWENKEWKIVISRPLKRPNGSILEVGKGSFVAFAVWQGGLKEVGSRKSLNMTWVPIQISETIKSNKI